MAGNLVRGDSDTVLYTNDKTDKALFASGRMRAWQSNVGNATISAGCLVLKGSCAADATVAAFSRGTFSYAATASEGAWAVGDPIFLDTTTGLLTKVANANCAFAGVCPEIKADLATVGQVILNARCQGRSVAKAAGANPTQAEFGALINALVNVGVIKFST